jgi:hypothetical protein
LVPASYADQMIGNEDDQAFFATISGRRKVRIF